MLQNNTTRIGGDAGKDRRTKGNVVDQEPVGQTSYNLFKNATTGKDIVGVV